MMFKQNCLEQFDQRCGHNEGEKSFPSTLKTPVWQEKDDWNKHEPLK